MPQESAGPERSRGGDRAGLPAGRSTGAGRSAPWRGQVDTRTRGDGRWLRTVILALAGTATLAGVVWVVRFLKATEGTLVVVVSDAFAPTDLRLPAGIYERKAAEDFLAGAKNEKRRRWDVLKQYGRDEPWPVAIAGPESWVRKLEGARQTGALIYVSQPGGADEQGRPFLFDAAGQRLPAADLLAAARRAVPQARLLVVFDATHTPTDWRRGLLVNDFAGGLTRVMNAAPFKDDANLFVICSSGPDQRSWAADDCGGGVFARYLRDGLSGKARPSGGDGPVSVAALYQYLAEQVNGWARRSRAIDKRPFAQTPLLLPDGALERAAEFIIGYADLAAPTTSAIAAVDLAPSRKLWERCESLARRTPAPAVYAPRGWRRYRELLLRHEALLRAGRDGRPVEAAAVQLADALERERTYGGGEPALAVSLPMAAALGLQAAPNPTLLERLRSEEPAEKVVAGLGSDAATRLAVLSGLYEWASQAATPDELDRAADRMTLLDNQRLSRPAEVHLAVMLSRLNPSLRPRGAFERPDPAVVRQALAARRAAEQAALPSAPAGGYPYCQHLPRELWDTIAETDRVRRRAEDLLFADPPYPDGQDPASRFKSAQKKYEDVSAVFAVIRTSLSARDRAFADLPYLADWIAADRSEDNARLAEAVWRDAHDLADRLAALDPTAPPGAVRPADLVGPPPNQANAPSLEQLASRVEGGLNALEGAYRRAVEGLASAAMTQSRLHGIENALVVPGLLPAGDRANLIAKCAQTAAYLARDAGPQDEIGGASGVSEAQLSNFHGRLAQSMMAGVVTRPTAASGGESARSAAWTDLGAAYWRLDINAEPSGGAESTELSPSWERAALLAPSGAARGAEPALAGRQRRWADAFRRLARRAELDHWYDETGEPLSDALAEKLYAAASKKEGDEHGHQLRQRRPAGRLTVRPVAPLVFTTQPEDAAVFRVNSMDAKLFEPGYVALTSRPPDVPAVRLADAPRQHWFDLHQPVDFSVRLRFDGPERLKQTVAGQLPLAAFYRGQRGGDQSVAPVSILPIPDLTVVQPPRRPKAQFTVRAGDEFQQGSLAIILDCSGSMAVPSSKFADAKKALERLFSDIPNGTRVCLFAYGHKGERSIEHERLTDLVRWGPAQRDIFGAKVRALNALGYTPLLDTMIEAANFLEQSSPAGSRTLVVLSDGCHLTTEEDRQPVGIQRIAKRFADEFVAKPRGVAVRLILFAVGEAEAATARGQFQAITRVQPSGSIEDAANLDALIQQLGRSVRPLVTTYRGGARMPSEFHALVPNDVLDWFPREQLPAGEYEIQVPGVERQRIRLHDGEKLPLRLVSRGGRSGFVRDLLAFDKGSRITRLTDESAPGYALGWLTERGPLNETDTWLAGKFTLEERASAREFAPTLAVDRPRFVWWELKDDKAAALPKGSRVTSLSGESAPAWDVRCKPFGGVQRSVYLDVWCLRDNLPVAAQVSFKGTPLSLPAAGEPALTQVTAAYETFALPADDAGHEFKPERCLVVRLRGSGGRLFAIDTDLDDLPSAAAVQAYYLSGEATYTTAAFRAGTAPGPVAIRVVAVDRAKAEAEQRRTHYHHRLR